jgi:patatin-like phospholipase/acyl hydrolase
MWQSFSNLPDFLSKIGQKRGEMDLLESSPLARKIREEKPLRRILALDGGGVRGVFAIEILAQIEKLYREKFKQPDAVLADYFDFVGGTSTGAIIATCVSWGMPMERIRQFYQEKARQIFAEAAWYLRWKHRFLAHNITNLLREQFANEDGSEALLDTPRLKTVLLAAMQNVSTGSAWPVTNNPFAKYNGADNPESNLKIPVWKLVRASTAAPTFFEPETIKLGENTFVCVDLVSDGDIALL